ncbi:hypothetical protein Y032_0023g736 [Ancylostoma ceylanicum]|nr:hypothetical protein Y032_0023g736 [Ancylostoma ceylanicum]
MAIHLLLFALLTILQHLPYLLGQVLVQYQLPDLWKNRGSTGVHLFPTLTSTVYPGFAGFERENGSSRIHLTAEDARKYAQKLNGSEITSICSYNYMGTVFYVANTDLATGDFVEVSVNLTMAELETTTEEMLKKRMKPSYICRGADGRFQ